MKIWNGYGSEHSTNLKMIGTFLDDADAKTTETIFDRIQKHVYKEMEDETWSPGDGLDLPDDTYELLRELNIYCLNPADIENFAYEYSLDRQGDTLVMTTDENEISGFVKLMVDNHAKVEIFSLHTHDGTGRREADRAEGEEPVTDG